MSDAWGNLYTDRRRLTTQAYADSKNLDARASIYRYQQPYVDLIGWALEQIAWTGAEWVLDVGCGPGRYLQRLAQRPGLRLIGMDLSRGMLADLVRGWEPATPRPYLATADVQALPLPSASCDVALAMHMLYHAPDIARAAGELRRVLRPGGTLLAVTNGDGHLREIDGAACDAITALSGRPGDFFMRGRFSLENGADLLQSAFDHVERRVVTSTLYIPETAPVLAYIASTRSITEKKLLAGVTWAAFVAELERIVTARIAQEGVLRVETVSGVFICT